MDLTEWRERQEKGEEAELPSGLVVSLRRVGMMDLAASGKIPVDLQPKIDELLQSGTKGKDPKVSLQWFREFADVVALVVGACLAGPEGLDASELGNSDQMAIFTWANEEGGKLRPFRRQQDGAVDPRRTGAAVRAETEPVSKFEG